MNTSSVELERAVRGDTDLDELLRISREPSVLRYLSLSDNYFNYVTETEGVYYYKIMVDGVPVGGIHGETDGNVLYLSVCVSEKYRRLGIAETSLMKYFAMLPDTVKTIEVGIEETNIPSRCLFEKLGFRAAEWDQGLITYRKRVSQ